jgi:hypothetical protein
MTYDATNPARIPQIAQLQETNKEPEKIFYPQMEMDLHRLFRKTLLDFNPCPIPFHLWINGFSAAFKSHRTEGRKLNINRR